MEGGFAHLQRPHDRRELAEGTNWDWLRRSLFKTVLDFAGGPAMLEKEAFRMATGGEEGCALVKNDELQKAS